MGYVIMACATHEEQGGSSVIISLPRQNSVVSSYHAEIMYNY